MIVHTRIVGLFGASAITVFPFILVYPGESTPEHRDESLLKHRRKG